MTDIIIKILLFLHIAGGLCGLLSGTINLFRQKGDRWHRLAGRIFVYSIVVAGLSAIVLSLIHPNYFLLVIGLFTIYLVVTGNRYLRLRMLGEGQQPGRVDWSFTIGMLITGIVFLVFGLRLLLKQDQFGVTLMVFGLLGLLFVRKDYKNYAGRSRAKNYWLLEHLQRMTGAYAAALTAFLVVNAENFPFTLPALLYWLLPTVVLSPMIMAWTRKRRVGKNT